MKNIVMSSQSSIKSDQPSIKSDQHSFHVCVCVCLYVHCKVKCLLQKACCMKYNRDPVTLQRLTCTAVARKCLIDRRQKRLLNAFCLKWSTGQ